MGQSKMAVIGIKADGYRLRDITTEISAFKEVIYLVLLTGRYDLFAEVVCKDKDHLLDLLTHKLYKVKGVRGSETFMYRELVKEEYTYNLFQKKIGIIEVPEGAMSLQGKETKSIFNIAKQYIPHGVNSNFRYLGTDDTLIISKGDGAYIWDADGNRFIDFRLGFGPVILGHGYSLVIEAIKAGTTFAWTTSLEVSVAEKLTEMCKIDKVRMTNSGTEATMHALPITRSFTNREKFIKFDGQ